MLEWMKGSPAVVGYQFLLRDDGSFVGRPLPIDENSYIEKDANGKGLAAWAMSHSLVKYFPGYKGIKETTVTVSHQRDIFYDPYNQMMPGERPKQGADLTKDFVSTIAEAKCYKHEKAPTSSIVFNKAVYLIGGVMVILGLALGARAVWF